MKITLFTYGSRGDFQPYLALAVGLQKAGHLPLIAAPGRFAEFAAQYNIPFAPLAGDPVELSRNFNDAGVKVFRMVKAMQNHVFAIAPQVVEQIRDTCRGADLIVHSFLFTTGAHTFARQLGIPDVSVMIFPMFAPTRAYPNVAVTNIPPGRFSYFSHWLATKIFWYGGNSGYYRLRKSHRLDLPRKLYWPFRQNDGRPPTPLLFGYSPSLLPRPNDWKREDIHIPGYFFLDEAGYDPPPELIQFLQEGEAPVCISFGSMIHRQSEKIRQILLEGLERNGQRGIILSGWSNWKPDSNTRNVLWLESAPHGWLFPRCRAIVHHGGAGTTGAGLRSGKPNIIIPFVADQPFWGKQVHAQGAGPRPIPVGKLNVDSFTAALASALEDKQMQERATDIGMKIRSEDGVGNAIRLIEEHAANFSP